MAAPGGGPIRIAVLLKQVPEVTEQAIDPATGRLQREGVELLMNPFDRRASLEACRIREDLGDGHLIALTMGPRANASALRRSITAASALRSLTTSVGSRLIIPPALRFSSIKTTRKKLSNRALASSKWLVANSR